MKIRCRCTRWRTASIGRAAHGARSRPGGCCAPARSAASRCWRTRRQGAGSAVLHALLEAARQRGEPLVRLYAQDEAVPFYLRHGFTTIGEPFDALGVPHVEMVRAP